MAGKRGFRLKVIIEKSRGEESLMEQDTGSFHLYRFNFPFIYQFYSRMAIIVE